MITNITEGLTPAQFIDIMNTNFYLTVGEYTEINTEMTGIELQTAINSNMSRSDTMIGIDGNSYLSLLNSNFAEKYNLPVSLPDDITVAWIDDFARMTWTNNSWGTQAEIWESKNGGVFTYLGITELGVESYDAYTWQNADVKLKLRLKKDGNYSLFSEELDITTPLVFQMDQTALQKVVFLELNILPGKTVYIDWGDDVVDELTGDNDDIEHEYIEEDIYFITLSGDLNDITRIDFSIYWDGEIPVFQENAFGDLSKWILPTSLGLFHFYSHSFTGDISNWILPHSTYDIAVFHISNNNFSGDISNWLITPTLVEMTAANNNLTGDISGWILPVDNGRNYFYIRVPGNDVEGDISEFILPYNCKLISFINTKLGGDISDWVIPDGCTSFSLCTDGDETSFEGDISGWTLPQTTSSIGYTFRMEDSLLTGDLSSWLIPDNSQSSLSISFYCKKSDFTKMPRGNFLRVTMFDFSQNNCDATEIENFLAYVDAYFVGGVVPLYNCTYDLSGTGMGIASAAALISKASIEGKYTAAGKTATITVN